MKGKNGVGATEFKCIFSASSNGEEVMSEGKLIIPYTCTSDGKRVTSNGRKSNGRNRQTIGGRGPKSLPAVHVNNRRYSGAYAR